MTFTEVTERIAGGSDAALAAIIRGHSIPWTAVGPDADAIVRRIRSERIAGLVYECVGGLRESDRCPADVRERLAADARAQAAAELLNQHELRSVVRRLHAERLPIVFLKGTALAYSLYAAPWQRPRVDNDIFIRRADVDRFRTIMSAMGYSSPLHCDGELLFCQFPLQKETGGRFVCRFDCHWKISTQPVFADVLTFNEAIADAIALPALGVHAKGLSPVHALLLACIHPVMHHRNERTLLWLYDIHLLASSLSDRDLERFAGLAAVKRVAAICASQLETTAATFGTRIPAAIRATLKSPEAGNESREPSAAYLRQHRTWIDEVVSSVGALPTWSDRVRLLREITVPSPRYVLRAYGFEASPLALAALPLLYAHRLVSGGWRAVAGRK
ncbi:MAG TPA: nucleotidyltransferase family protein [Vicinamibacterales bacterium]|nr:nucleotidyltransferase family protein [Vicinamibacterales bacterium]